MDEQILFRMTNIVLKTKYFNRILSSNFSYFLSNPPENDTTKLDDFTVYGGSLGVQSRTISYSFRGPSAVPDFCSDFYWEQPLGIVPVPRIDYFDATFARMEIYAPGRSIGEVLGTSILAYIQEAPVWE